MRKTPLKRKSKSETSILQRKCDDLLQDRGREMYKKCEICSKPMDCMHHFFTKRSSNRLRYDWDNLIPICRGCHFAHHNKSDPTIHATVIRKRGQNWYNLLLKKKQETIKTDVPYYKYILEMLSK